jgi:hypothetical protein
MGITPIKSVLIAATAAASLLVSGCSADKAAAPPKPGTLAHSWVTANQAYKAGDYPRAMQHLSRVATAQSEYRDKARIWLVVVAGGIADGYLKLSDAYDEGAKTNKAVAMDYRNQVRELRNTANTAALAFAETVHDILKADKDPKFNFDFGFPAGDTSEPVQLAKTKKGLSMQAADHEVVRKKMAEAGVVRFAALLAGSPTDLAKAREQFAKPNRDAVLTGFATNLVGTADLYCQRKLDMPKRGNALCKEASEALALLPDSKEKKQLDAKVKEEVKRHKVES